MQSQKNLRLKFLDIELQIRCLHDHAFAHDLLRFAKECPRRSGQSGSSRSSSKLSMSPLSRDVSVGARRKKWGWSLTLTMKYSGYKQCGPHLISPPKLRNMLNQGCWRVLDVRRRSLQDKPTSDGDMNKWNCGSLPTKVYINKMAR